MDENGNFVLTFHVNAEGDAKELYIEFVCPDCTDFDMRGDGDFPRQEFVHTDYNGLAYKKVLNAGKYVGNLNMQCLNMSLGENCDNSHDI